MIEKWERQPQRIGMLLGFAAVPLLMMLQGAVLHLAFAAGAPFRFDVLPNLVHGAVPGAILGTGISQAAFAWRKGDVRRAKLHLLLFGSGVLGLIVLLLSPLVWSVWSSSLNPSARTVWLGQQIPNWAVAPVMFFVVGGLPLQIALLMLFIGLLMRSKR